MWEGHVFVGGPCLCERALSMWEGRVFVRGLCLCGRAVFHSRERVLHSREPVPHARVLASRVPYPSARARVGFSSSVSSARASARAALTGIGQGRRRGQGACSGLFSCFSCPCLFVVQGGGSAKGRAPARGAVSASCINRRRQGQGPVPHRTEPDPLLLCACAHVLTGGGRANGLGRDGAVTFSRRCRPPHRHAPLLDVGEMQSNRP